MAKSQRVHVLRREMDDTIIKAVLHRPDRAAAAVATMRWDHCDSSMGGWGGCSVTLILTKYSNHETQRPLTFDRGDQFEDKKKKVLLS